MTTFVDKELTKVLLVYCHQNLKIVYIFEWANFAILFSVVTIENFNIIIVSLYQ
jgi:hypothetical protein